MTRRVLYFLYGLGSYAIFFATYVYAVGFVANLMVPTSLDAPAEGSFGAAFAINLGLLGLFAVQHSVMARKGFKDAWTKIVPKPLERSTYTLFSSLCLIALFAWWQPMGGVVWSVGSPIGRALLLATSLLGFGIVLVSTFLIHHFDLFGLRQVWLHLLGREYTPLKFGTPVFYRYVRHPLYVGWLLAFWAAPVMTAAHLVFAVTTTAYILVAIRLEERDLVREHGKKYEAYRRSTPMLIPFSKSRQAA